MERCYGSPVDASSRRAFIFIPTELDEEAVSQYTVLWSSDYPLGAMGERVSRCLNQGNEVLELCGKKGRPALSCSGITLAYGKETYIHKQGKAKTPTPVCQRERS